MYPICILPQALKNEQEIRTIWVMLMKTKCWLLTGFEIAPTKLPCSIVILFNTATYIIIFDLDYVVICSPLWCSSTAAMPL
jgi:hypothetical protein